MKILLSNDDGINAAGIQALREAMETVGEVVIVAPDRPKSASGHGITVHKPLRVDEIRYSNSSTKGYAVNGTPSDCVKLALEGLLTKRPDIVVSGINFGPNLGTDVLYSGTVSAALEGVIHGIPSIAVSLASYEKEDYTLAARAAIQVVKAVVEKGLPDETLLNINVPAVPEKEIKGITVTKLGKRIYKNTFEKRKDPRGRDYYWMAGEAVDLAGDPDTDINAVKRNEISVTPIVFDITNYQLIKKLQEWNLSLEG
ncbi:stationary-phase survival protein SurE [Thermincola ferriacetica]|uniref:5'-nucleotidase SurE n=1 Tax=Thermincola ferriacetica TaxID=281456 RepID=A0A0L6W3S5_9FIRM|nr:5'/3'-nucleotidase SurE [Thermincola ferriacetica]KNZ70237.1 stationary-phase survival protein SurE [Thermincola ferriacetica]